MFFRALFDLQKLFPWADKCICKTKLQTAPTEGPTAGFPSKSQTWMTGRRQPASKTKPEIPHLRSTAEGIELNIPRSKSQIEEPKLKCSHFIYLTCNHNGWDRLIVETSFYINDQLGAVSKINLTERFSLLLSPTPPPVAPMYAVLAQWRSIFAHR